MPDTTISRLSDQSVSTLKGVGPAVADKLAKLKITSLQDVLFHLPIRYEDRTRITPIGHMRPGFSGLIEASVQDAQVQFGKRRSLRVRVSDPSGLITLRFYHFGANLRAQLLPGTTIRAWGEARRGASGLEIYHPEMKIISSSDVAPPLDDRLSPIYGTTDGLHQATWKKLTDQALLQLQNQSVDELVPSAYLASDLPSLSSALLMIHRPEPGMPLSSFVDGTHPAVQRLALEELVAHHLSLINLRQTYRERASIPIQTDGALASSLLAQLPFKPTKAQTRVSGEIASDLARPEAMLRLVQGDVGSGKTLVAACAAAHVIERGFQVVIMAPTEILAEQHYHSFSEWFEPLGIKVAWLVSKLSAKQKRETLAAMKSGEIQLIVGTHAVFQNDVHYSNLALVVIDEQHRFGVDQRLALRNKGVNGAPHQLVMTATPIPRTLAMTAYADLDVSVIDELPPGRTPIQTVVISNSRRDDVVERVRANCLQGRQAYWVCTLIDESEAVEAEAAEEIAQSLTAVLPELSVGLVHGRLKADEKADIMQRFNQNEIQLLVATTVIEVGVNVPNATVMVIENAERLGLAQLHQLRGRVGRGSDESYCVLLYSPPLSNTAKSRLSTMRETTDGFLIAERDLELRGAGELLGTRQTGDAAFKIAQLDRDQMLLATAKHVAESLYEDDKPAVRELIHRWLAGKEKFANA